MKKLLAVVDELATAISVTDAPVDSSLYITKKEWKWLRREHGSKVPVKETRRLSARPKCVLPGPHTCRFCSHLNTVCSRGHEIENVNKGVCAEWTPID